MISSVKFPASCGGGTKRVLWYWDIIASLATASLHTQLRVSTLIGCRYFSHTCVRWILQETLTAIGRGSIPFLRNSILVRSDSNNTQNLSFFANQFLDFVCVCVCVRTHTLKLISICSHCEKNQKLYCLLCFCAFKTGLKVWRDRSWLSRSPEPNIKASYRCLSQEAMPSSLLGQQPHSRNWEFIYPTSLLCPRPFPRAQLTTALNYECTFCDLNMVECGPLRYLPSC